jgi:O-antigen ligase
MKKLFFINDTVENKISYYHLALFLVALPYDFFYSELILISFGIHTLIHFKKTDFKNILRKPVLVIISLYLLNGLAIFYSADKQEGINLAVRQLAVLLFPVLFALSHLNFAKYKLQLLCIFGFSCTLTTLYLYFDAMHTIFNFGMPVSSLFTATFMNHNFSLPIGIHATYLSMYLAFSIIAFLFMLLSGFIQKQKWIYIIACVTLLAGLLQLSSRAVFIAFLIVINGVFPFLLFKGRKRVQFFLTASAISAAVLLLIFNVDTFRTRYVSELKTDLTDKVKIIENTEPRLARWEAIFELIKKSPVIGYGNGSETRLLQEKYFEKGLYISYLNEFNTHNQYLSIMLKTGIIGLLLFLYILYFGYATAIRNRYLLLLAFMIIITVVSLSENILDLNKGIFFYSFFFSILVVQHKSVIEEDRSWDIAESGNPGKFNSV